MERYRRYIHSRARPCARRRVAPRRHPVYPDDSCYRVMSRFDFAITNIHLNNLENLLASLVISSLAISETFH
uniref:Uncharacterized protein n=1 Tax=Caenorhabditis japonica TaxID=281687 RepID=A0A8R1ILP3_CAEJA